MSKWCVEEQLPGKKDPTQHEFDLKPPVRGTGGTAGREPLSPAALS